MKKFFKKHEFTLIFGLIITIILSIVITINFDNLIYAINTHTDRQFEDITKYQSSSRMISTGENNMRSTPISAKIVDGILTVEANLKNNTGKNLKLDDYAIMTFGGYDFAGDIKFDGDGTINDGSELKVTYELNVSTFRNINVVPTSLYVELGTNDSNNNYYEYNMKYTISWS